MKNNILNRSGILKKSTYAFFAVLLLTTACKKEVTPTSQGTATAVAPKIPVVSVVSPSSSAFEGNLNITGVIQPNKTVSIHAMENGFISKMYKDIGDRVKKGETVATLTNPELVQMKREIQVEIDATKKQYDRYKSIYDATPELTNVFDLEKMEADYKRAHVKLQGIDTRLGFMRIRAPFSGVVTRRHLDEGALVQSGLSQTQASPLIEIMELQKVRLIIELPESEISLVKKGSLLDIHFPEIPGKNLQAKVTRMSYNLNPQTKTMRVEVDLPNADQSLKPGMYAKVSMKLDTREKALAIPILALVSEKGQHFVYKMEDQRVKKTQVTLGLEDKFNVEILEGLTQNDQVVVKGKELVSDGTEVQAVKGN